MSDMRVLYLCNGLNPMCKKNSCGYLNMFDDMVCFHTTNPEFAINGPIEKSPLECNADRNVERPLFILDGTDYWEGFVGLGKLAKTQFKFKENEYPKQFTCGVCGCVFEATKNEYKFEDACRNEYLYSCTCPTCHRNVMLYE